MINKTQKRRIRRKALEVLYGSKCADCDSKDELDFDHIDPSSKKFDISQGLDFSLNLLLTEVAKCQLLCRGCHVAKTLSDKHLMKSEHGMLSMYTNKKCRCNLCRGANRRYVREYRRG